MIKRLTEKCSVVKIGLEIMRELKDYHGGSDYIITVPAEYEPLVIANIPKTEEFKTELLAHQQGKTDHLIFIKICTETGIEKWEILMDKMTCTYFDKAGNEILVE